MKKRFLFRSRRAMRLLAIAVICTWLPVSIAWGQATLPPPELVPLNQVAVPEPPNLFQFVKNKPAAIRLGKALFWDMQVGSDGIVACATCHFSAGTDNRIKNTMNPGFDNIFEVRGPNETLQPSDFPFHQRDPVDFQVSTIVRDTNDIVGSQGVRLTQFVDIVPGSAVDIGTPISDPVFNVGGNNTRRVTGRNTPSNINAIFNFNNFWDGRAHFTFNGVSPFGPADLNASVWFNEAGILVKKPVAIEFASLASQAVGPPLNDVEMSFRGRTFPQLGRKMLSLTPLGKQLVHPGDSVLGTLSKAVRNPDGTISVTKGLNATYSQMIRDAFFDKFWNSTQMITLPEGQFTQMEANFSLFWGLAIQLWEATLVSDQTPFDRFLGGDNTALTPEQQDGFNTFFGAGRCNECHAASELTATSVGNARFLTNADNALIELMPVAAGFQVIYDDGFNNISVRPTTDDIGRGGTAPFVNPLTSQNFPLSFSLMAELQAQNLLPFEAPILPDFLPPDFPVNVNGSFKVPSLRNVELTDPYFHNGGAGTLDHVVEFYTRGGNFPLANINDLDINIDEIGQLRNSPDRRAALVAFLKSMTDERVRNQSAPFDHPELFIPEGDPEVLIKLPARDANGQAALVADDVADLVTKFYNDILGRAPEPGGAEFWTAEINRVTALGIDVKEGFQGLAKFFFNSSEYLLKNTDNNTFVTDLYRTFLNRDPDPAGLTFWLDQLAQGLTRDMLIIAFANSAEFELFLQNTFGDIFTRPENNLVNDLYRGILNRFPDNGGFTSWLGQMRAAQCTGAQSVRDVSGQIASAFINSPEYSLRGRDNAGYVEDLYNAFLRRGADPAGFNFWVVALNTQTRDQVLGAFVASPEFQLRVDEVVNAGCLP